MQPSAARLLPTIFPDNPLVLEGMTALYLNSAKAAELRLREPNQVDALYRWLNAGGHLIVGVEQISDVASTPWLDQLFRGTEGDKTIHPSSGTSGVAANWRMDD
jgi:hypothetical protein